MAKTPASRKAKGKRAENLVAKRYREIGLFPDAKAMPMSGAMEFHKTDIFTREVNEFAEEVKNQEKVKLWEWWAQAEQQASGLQRPALHITGNYRPMLSVLRFEDFADMRLELKQLREFMRKAQEKEIKGD